MEQLIHAFGIDVKLIIVQMINFVVLLGLLSYFLYKPVLKLLADREENIAQGIKDAEAAAVAKSEADIEKQAVLSAAHTEASEINERAKTTADDKATAIVADANHKAAGIVSDATKKGEEIKARLEKESEAEVAKLAVLAAEKILSKKA